MCKNEVLLVRVVDLLIFNLTASVKRLKENKLYFFLVLLVYIPCQLNVWNLDSLNLILMKFNSLTGAWLIINIKIILFDRKVFA